jgi:Tfp pilus assembly protein PilF
MTLNKGLLAIVLALWGFGAVAQTLPKPKEFYFDEDRGVTRPIVAVEGLQGDALAEQLVKIRERGRRAIEATAQLAQVAIAGGRAELGKSLYQQALNSTQTGGTMWRSISWNYAWDLYRLGEFQAALTHWAGANNSVGAPAWVPPTLALGLWSVDRKTEAVQWYAAAVRTEPNLWNDPANFARLLPTWNESERSRLAEVHAAWQANPPAWP